MPQGVWLAAGGACLAVMALGAAPAQAASLAVRAASKSVRVASVAAADVGAPRYYYRAYRPYYSQYYWRPHYYNTIVSDQPFHAQPVPWWATGDRRRYAIGPAYGY